MLSKTWVVLHRPIYPRNIGMCARAMGNLGLDQPGQLHIIAPRCDWTSSMVLHQAHQGATHSGDILRTAVLHPSLESFLSTHGSGTRIAFSAREGTGKRIQDFADLLRDIRSEPGGSHPLFDPKLATQLHFGTEDDGLTLEELEPMNFICRLPSTNRIPSFNLSHAVLIALYIYKAELGITNTPVEKSVEMPAEMTVGAKLEYPKRAIREWLEALGFDLNSRRVSIETSLNRILLSHCPSAEDVRLLEKVLFQTVEKLKSGEKNSQEKART